MNSNQIDNISINLFIKNQKEEFIGIITLNGYSNLNQIFSTSSSPKIVISDYSREENILNSNPTITMSSVSHQDKLVGFGKYLQQRNKAGVATLSNGDIIYLLPPNEKSFTNIRCTIKYHNSPSVKTQNNSQSKQTANNHVTTTTPPTDFLSSLLDKANTVRSQLSHNSTPAISTAALTVLQQFEDNIKNQFIELLSLDDGLEEEKYRIIFPPLEREQRYIIYSVLEDYDNLISVDEGEGIERHLVIYRKGHEPIEPVINPAPTQTIERHVPIVVSKPITNEVKPLPVGTLIKANQVKRDRRTIEEVKADIKKRRTEPNGNNEEVNEE